MKTASGRLVVALMLAFVARDGFGQTASSGVGASTSSESPKAPAITERTFFLKNVSQPSDANEVFTALRQLEPAYVKCLLVPSEDAIIVHGNPEDIALAQKVIDDLDRPRKTYRLTFTVAEMDGTKLIGTQHFAMVAVAGQMTTVKQGSKVPVRTGPPGTQFTQSTYLDMGMTFEATLEDSVNGAILKSRVEDSGFQEDKSGDASGQPVVTRNTSLEGASYLTPGKPLMLGSLDIPGTTRRLDVQVLLEALP